MTITMTTLLLEAMSNLGQSRIKYETNISVNFYWVELLNRILGCHKIHGQALLGL